MQYKQLQLIYEKLYAISLEENEMISQKQYASINQTSDRKNKLINQLNQTMKILKEQSTPDNIEELKNKFINQEKENIENLKNNKITATLELNKLTKDLKLITAYSQKTPSANMVDIQE